MLFFLSTPLEAEWKRLKSGFDYRRIDFPQTHFFRINLNQWRLDLLVASHYGSSAMTGRRFQEQTGAVLVINGGFFDEFFHSLGLLVKKGGVLNPLREASWGIFLVKEKEREASIVSRRGWQPARVSTMALAIQVGPRLVIDGKIPSFKESGPSRRSAIGITKEGLVIIALNEAPISLHEWARLLQKECRYALNLDGGGSSQIVVKAELFSLNVEGMTAVPNAIGLFEK